MVCIKEKEHGVNQKRVIGGVCDCCLKAGMRFYGGMEEQTYFDTTPKPYNSLRIPMHPVSNIEIAEITKNVGIDFTELGPPFGSKPGGTTPSSTTKPTPLVGLI